VGAYADIPLTLNGDVGPIAWDFDGDGVYDFYESLIYKPSDEQLMLLFDYRYSLNPDDFINACKEYRKSQSDLVSHREGRLLLNWCEEKKI
jgi:hypothetical protein